MRIKVHFWYFNASTIVLTIECYRIKAVFHFNHTVAQYSEWIVGSLNSATCPPMFMQFTVLAANSQFWVSIGQKMQLTG